MNTNALSYRLDKFILKKYPREEADRLHWTSLRTYEVFIRFWDQGIYLYSS